MVQKFLKLFPQKLPEDTNLKLYFEPLFEKFYEVVQTYDFIPIIDSNRIMK